MNNTLILCSEHWFTLEEKKMKRLIQDEYWTENLKYRFLGSTSHQFWTKSFEVRPKNMNLQQVPRWQQYCSGDHTLIRLYGLKDSQNPQLTSQQWIKIQGFFSQDKEWGKMRVSTKAIQHCTKCSNPPSGGKKRKASKLEEVKLFLHTWSQQNTLPELINQLSSTMLT